MTAKEVVQEIVSEKGMIRDVYFVACGGSLVDLYPGYYFIESESKTMHASWLTSKELVINPPKHLGEDSLVLVCSHSGNTPETVEAACLARDMGAFVVIMTHNPDSASNDESLHPWIYDWSDEVPEAEKPQGIVLAILNELMKAQEPEYALYEKIGNAFARIDKTIADAMKKVQNKTWLFAEYYANEPFLYIMGSGASYSQAYGFAICSLQEMQWMDCCYLHSGEYFHGPFEVTDEDHLYVVLMSEGKNRVMDERAVEFLGKYGKKIEVIDARDFGMGEYDKDVVEYFNPMLFYKMSVAYRTALQNKRCHPQDMRRYMGVVPY